jgi:hypothetical protein
MGYTGSWDEGAVDPSALAAAMGLTVPDPKTMRMKVLQSSLRSRVNAAPMNARPAVAPVAPEPAPATAAPAGPDFAGQRARIEAALEELNQPKDLAALQAEGKRRGERGNTDMLLALAAQQAGPGFEGVQQTMLRQAMAARDPMKFTGGIVNEQGDVVEDPYFKQQEQRAMYERRLAGLDRGENAAAMAAAERARREEALRLQEAGRNDRAAERNALLMTLKSMGIAAKGAGKDAAAAGPGKTMPQSALKSLGELQSSAQGVNRLASEFKPEFAGAKGALNAAAGRLPFVDTDAAEWWRNYRKEAELVQRHELFGATLTGAEQNAWRAADISPSMAPEAVARNLERRAQIAREAFTRSVQTQQKAGYNAAEPFGVEMGAAPARAPAAPAAAAAPAAGSLSPAEQAELDQLRARFGKR